MGRDQASIGGRNNDRYELHPVVNIIVKLTCDYRPFPSDAKSASGFLMAPKPTNVGFGNDQQHEVRLVYLVCHARRPRKRWSALNELIDPRVDSLSR
jgi:hypothetical protein